MSAALTMQTCFHDFSVTTLKCHTRYLCYVSVVSAHLGEHNNRSPPYEPNHNPVEHYIDIIVSMARSMLFVSGLDPTTYWTHALEHAVYLQIRTALPGRATPFEHSFGRRPIVTNLRIFGCEALSYIEKSKRTKFNPKVERAIYLGVSPDHTEDTYKLLQIATQSIIYRRNVFFNEHSFPAQKYKPTPLTIPNSSADSGHDLIGCDFEDDGVLWHVTRIGTYEGTPVLFYKNKDTGEEESSSVPEVRLWHSQTALKQAINQIKPTRKGYINTLAGESFKAIQTYDLKLPAHSTKSSSYKKAGNQPLSQWFRAEAKERDKFLEFDT
jgi:hypothetical protein